MNLLTKAYTLFTIALLGVACAALSGCDESEEEQDDNLLQLSFTDARVETDAGSGEADTGAVEDEQTTNINGCKPGKKYYVPSWCSERDDPWFMPGCYQECEVEKDICSEGECRLTNIDPCDCPPSGPCCDTCGEPKWLCLPKATMTCEEIKQKADEIINGAIRNHDLFCEKDDECVLVKMGTACGGGCHNAFSVDGAEDVERAIREADERYCNDYAQGRCPVVMPGCVPSTAICLDNQCVLELSEE